MGFIIIDSATNRPMGADQALALLEETNALERLRALGFNAGQFRTAVEIPTTQGKVPTQLTR